MGKHGNDIERAEPIYTGEKAEQFAERWNAVTTSIKNAAGAAKARKEGNSHGGK